MSLQSASLYLHSIDRGPLCHSKWQHSIQISVHCPFHVGYVRYCTRSILPLLLYLLFLSLVSSPSPPSLPVCKYRWESPEFYPHLQVFPPSCFDCFQHADTEGGRSGNIYHTVYQMVERVDERPTTKMNNLVAFVLRTGVLNILVYQARP